MVIAPGAFTPGQFAAFVIVAGFFRVVAGHAMNGFGRFGARDANLDSVIKPATRVGLLPLLAVTGPADALLRAADARDSGRDGPAKGAHDQFNIGQITNPTQNPLGFTAGSGLTNPRNQHGHVVALRRESGKSTHFPENVVHDIRRRGVRLLREQVDHRLPQA